MVQALIALLVIVPEKLAFPFPSRLNPVLFTISLFDVSVTLSGSWLISDDTLPLLTLVSILSAVWVILLDSVPSAPLALVTSAVMLSAVWVILLDSSWQ